MRLFRFVALLALALLLSACPYAWQGARPTASALRLCRHACPQHENDVAAGVCWIGCASASDPWYLENKVE